MTAVPAAAGRPAAGCPVCKGDVAEIIATAYPVIAEAVRADVVAEILAARAEARPTRAGYAVGNLTYNEGLEAAARLAAGGEART